MPKLNLKKRISYLISNRRNGQKAKQFFKAGKRSDGIKALEKYVARMKQPPVGFLKMISSYKDDALVRGSDMSRYDQRQVLAEYLDGSLEKIQSKVASR